MTSRLQMWMDCTPVLDKGPDICESLLNLPPLSTHSLYAHNHQTRYAHHQSRLHTITMIQAQQQPVAHQQKPSVPAALLFTQFQLQQQQASITPYELIIAVIIAISCRYPHVQLAMLKNVIRE